MDSPTTGKYVESERHWNAKPCVRCLYQTLSLKVYRSILIRGQKDLTVKNVGRFYEYDFIDIPG